MEIILTLSTAPTLSMMPTSWGRGDLGAIVPVGLVAIVFGRIVGGGHDHPGVGVEVADREGELGGGPQGGKEVGP